MASKEKFSIPKLRTANCKDHLQKVELKARDCIILLEDIKKNSLDINYFETIQVVEVNMVHNAELAKKYLDKKQELKMRSNVALKEELGFFCHSTSKRQEIAKHGLAVGNNSTHGLGQSRYGVILCRFFDVELESGFFRDEKEIFIFKYLAGRSKALVCSNSNLLEPTPNFDSHVSSKSPNVSDSLQIKIARSKIYLYEYNEDCQPSKFPRQILPLAVLRVKKLPVSRNTEPLTKSLTLMPERSLKPSKTDPKTLSQALTRSLSFDRRSLLASSKSQSVTVESNESKAKSVTLKSNESKAKSVTLKSNESTVKSTSLSVPVQNAPFLKVSNKSFSASDKQQAVSLSATTLRRASLPHPNEASSTRACIATPDKLILNQHRDPRLQALHFVAQNSSPLALVNRSTRVHSLTSFPLTASTSCNQAMGQAASKVSSIKSTAKSSAGKAREKKKISLSDYQKKKRSLFEEMNTCESLSEIKTSKEMASAFSTDTPNLYSANQISKPQPASQSSKISFDTARLLDAMNWFGQWRHPDEIIAKKNTLPEKESERSLDGQVLNAQSADDLPSNLHSLDKISNALSIDKPKAHCADKTKILSMDKTTVNIMDETEVHCINKTEVHTTNDREVCITDERKVGITDETKVITAEKAKVISMDKSAKLHSLEKTDCLDEAVTKVHIWDNTEAQFINELVHPPNTQNSYQGLREGRYNPHIVLVDCIKAIKRGYNEACSVCSHHLTDEIILATLRTQSFDIDQSIPSLNESEDIDSSADGDHEVTLSFHPGQSVNALGEIGLKTPKARKRSSQCGQEELTTSDESNAYSDDEVEVASESTFWSNHEENSKSNDSSPASPSTRLSSPHTESRPPSPSIFRQKAVLSPCSSPSHHVPSPPTRTTSSPSVSRTLSLPTYSTIPSVLMGQSTPDNYRTTHTESSLQSYCTPASPTYSPASPPTYEASSSPSYKPSSPPIYGPASPPSYRPLSPPTYEPPSFSTNGPSSPPTYGPPSSLTYGRPSSTPTYGPLSSLNFRPSSLSTSEPPSTSAYGPSSPTTYDSPSSPTYGPSSQPTSKPTLFPMYGPSSPPISGSPSSTTFGTSSPSESEPPSTSVYRPSSPPTCGQTSSPFLGPSSPPKSEPPSTSAYAPSSPFTHELSTPINKSSFSPTYRPPSPHEPKFHPSSSVSNSISPSPTTKDSYHHVPMLSTKPDLTSFFSFKTNSLSLKASPITPPTYTSHIPSLTSSVNSSLLCHVSPTASTDSVSISHISSTLSVNSSPESQVPLTTLSVNSSPLCHVPLTTHSVNSSPLCHVPLTTHSVNSSLLSHVPLTTHAVNSVRMPVNPDFMFYMPSTKPVKPAFVPPSTHPLNSAPMSDNPSLTPFYADQSNPLFYQMPSPQFPPHCPPSLHHQNSSSTPYPIPTPFSNHYIQSSHPFHHILSRIYSMTNPSFDPHQSLYHLPLAQLSNPPSMSVPPSVHLMPWLTSPWSFSQATPLTTHPTLSESRMPLSSEPTRDLDTTHPTLSESRMPLSSEPTRDLDTTHPTLPESRMQLSSEPTRDLDTTHPTLSESRMPLSSEPTKDLDRANKKNCCEETSLPQSGQEADRFKALQQQEQTIESNNESKEQLPTLKANMNTSKKNQSKCLDQPDECVVEKPSSSDDHLNVDKISSFNAGVDKPSSSSDYVYGYYLSVDNPNSCETGDENPSSTVDCIEVQNPTSSDDCVDKTHQVELEALAKTIARNICTNIPVHQRKGKIEELVHLLSSTKAQSEVNPEKILSKLKELVKSTSHNKCYKCKLKDAPPLKEEDYYKFRCPSPHKSILETEKLNFSSASLESFIVDDFNDLSPATPRKVLEVRSGLHVDVSDSGESFASSERRIFIKNLYKRHRMVKGKTERKPKAAGLEPTSESPDFQVTQTVSQLSVNTELSNAPLEALRLAREQILNEITLMDSIEQKGAPPNDKGPITTISAVKQKQEHNSPCYSLKKNNTVIKRKKATLGFRRKIVDIQSKTGHLSISKATVNIKKDMRVSKEITFTNNQKRGFNVRKQKATAAVLDSPLKKRIKHSDLSNTSKTISDKLQQKRPANKSMDAKSDSDCYIVEKVVRKVVKKQDMTLKMFIFSQIGFIIRNGSDLKLPFPMETVLDRLGPTRRDFCKICDKILEACAIFFELPIPSLVGRANRFRNTAKLADIAYVEKFSTQQLGLEIKVLSQCYTILIRQGQERCLPSTSMETVTEMFKLNGEDSVSELVSHGFEFKPPEFGHLLDSHLLNVMSSFTTVTKHFLGSFEPLNFGHAHCRLPEQLLIKEELDKLHSSRSSFHLLSAHIPLKDFKELLRLRCQLDELQMSTTKDTKEIARLSNEREKMLHTFLSKENAQYRDKLELLYNNFLVTEKYMKEIIGEAGLDNMPLFKSVVKLVERHFKLLRARLVLNAKK